MASSPAAMDEEKGDVVERRKDQDEQFLRRQIQMPEVKVTYRSLFRYSTLFDTLILWCSICCSLVAGAALPLMTVRSSPLSKMNLTLIASRWFLANLLAHSKPIF